ncbi:MAG TPA: hypothetical protein VHU80_24160 [Polyangiaceae bacterium]|nr:hypothetical protein [Polyangiaceae bacterium]
MNVAEDDVRAPGTVLAVAVALHAALLAYFFPARLFAKKLPILEYDYALHAYQVDRALSAFESHHALFSYDPLVLAGQPAGAIEDLTSKSVEAFVICAHALGVSPWVAFDAYVLAVHLGLIPAAWMAARLFGFDRLSAAVAVLFWVLVWHFDSFAHWCWYIGMISWGFASYLVVLVLAVTYRASKDHRARHYAGFAVLAALVTFVHPFAVLTLAVPLAGTYLRSRRAMAWWEHAALACGSVLAALTTLTWLGPALKFRHYIGPVDAFLWPSASYVLTDSLGLLRDLAMTGEPVRTSLRLVAFVLAFVGLVRMRREQDDRVLPVALLLTACIALAYLSGYSSLLRQTQPYRHIAPATLAAALFAACAVVRLGRDREALTREARAALVFALLASAPELVRTALGYLPGLLPAREHARTAFRPGPGRSGSSEERDPPFMGHTPPPDDYVRVAKTLSAIAADTGRVASLDWVLGEYLATFAELPTLGGIAERNVPQVAAHPLRHDLTPAHPGDDPVAAYLREYAVAAVVTKGDAAAFDGRDDLLEQVASVGPFRVYRVRRPTSYFAVGTGRVVVQRTNTLRVADAAGSEIVLRFHFMETLRCKPDCAIFRAPAERDSVGFIGVRDPPAAFEIFNAYD